MIALLKARFLANSPGFVHSAWRRIEASPLGYRLARGALWSLIGAVLSRGLGLLASIFVARMLGKDVFGALGIIQSTVGTFGVIAGFGLGLTATKYVAEFRENDPSRASRILALSAVVSWVTGILAATVLFTQAPWLAAKSLAAPHLFRELRVGALLVLFGAVNGAQTGALAGFEAFKRIAQVNFWAGVANFPCLTIGCWLGGLPGAVWGLTASQAIGCGLNRWALAQEARQHKVALWSPKWPAEAAILWRFSLPAVLATMFIVPSLWFCQSLLVRSVSGYNGMAEYSVGAQWRMLVQYLPGLLCAAYLPVAASVSVNRAPRLRKLMLANAGFGAGLAAVTSLVVFLCSPWILSAYGPGFATAKWVLCLMLLAGVVDSANTILMQTLMASDRAWLRLLSNSLWALLLLTTAWLLVPRYGAIGLAAAVFTAQSIHLCVQVPIALYATRVAARPKP